MRALSFLAISSSILLLCTSLATGKDSTGRRTRRPISNDKLERLRARIIAARRARLLRYRQSNRSKITITTTVAPTRSTITPSLCPDGCICSVINDVRCNLKSLKRIPRGLPSNTVNLDLGMNRITSIKRKDFGNIRATLLNLYLHNNSITSLGNGNFVELKKLKMLHLSYNKITEIRKLSLQGMVDLESLYLDYNKLTFINPLAFRGLTKLHTLHLEGNLLSQIHNDLFITMEFVNFFKFSSINRLNLQKNEFHRLPRHVFDHMTGSSVSLGFNPWDCSCQSLWLKDKISTLSRDRCGVVNSPGDCPICESPYSVKDLPMSDVTTTCPQSLQAESDRELFVNNGVMETKVTLLFVNNDRSVLGAKCHLSELPSVAVRKDDDSDRIFSSTFEGVFRCVVETFDSSSTAQALRSFEGRVFSLISRQQRNTNHGKYTEQYAVDGNLANPFTNVSVTTESAFLLNNRTTVRFLRTSASQDSAQPNVRKVALSTSFVYKYDPKKVSYSKQPWLEIRNPDPSLTDVMILQSGKEFSMRCKAVGQPKPTIEWVLPSDQTVRAGEKVGRFAVQKSGKLVIRSISPEDSGIYRCLATIRSPANRSMILHAETARSKIQVIGPTEEGFSVSDVSPETRQESVRKGESWRSSCQIKSLYDATIAWVTPDNRLMVGDSSYRHGQVTTYLNGTIFIADFRKSNEGLYRCVAVNVMEVKEYPLYVTVELGEDDALESTIIDYNEDERDFIETDVIPGVDLDFEDSDEFDDQIIDEVIIDDGLEQNQPTMTTTRSTTTIDANTPLKEDVDPVIDPVIDSVIDPVIDPVLDYEEPSDAKAPDAMAGEVIEIDLDDDEDYYDDEDHPETLETSETPPIENERLAQGLNKSTKPTSSSTPMTTSITTLTSQYPNYNLTKHTEGSPALLTTSVKMNVTSHESNSNLTNHNEASPALMATSSKTTVTSQYLNLNLANQNETSFSSVDKSSQLTASSKYSNSKSTNRDQASNGPAKSPPETTAESKYANFFKTPNYIIRKPIKIDSTYRTHLNKNIISLPMQPATSQPESPKFSNNRDAGMDFVDKVTLPQAESIPKPLNHDKVAVFPTQQERTSPNFKPQDEYLELRIEPDGTADPDDFQTDGATLPMTDINYNTHTLGVGNETSLTQDLYDSKHVENELEIDLNVDPFSQVVDPEIISLEPPTTAPIDQTTENRTLIDTTEPEIIVSRPPTTEPKGQTTPAAEYQGLSTSNFAPEQVIPDLINPEAQFRNSATEQPVHHHPSDATGQPEDRVIYNLSNVTQRKAVEEKDISEQDIPDQIDTATQFPSSAIEETVFHNPSEGNQHKQVDKQGRLGVTGPQPTSQNIVISTTDGVEADENVVESTEAQTDNMDDPQLIDADALIPDQEYDTDPRPTRSHPLDINIANEEKAENNREPSQVGLQNLAGSSNSADVIKQPELDIEELLTSYNPTTTSNAHSATNPVTMTTDSNDFEPTTTKSSPPRDVASDTVTVDIIVPPIATVSMTTVYDDLMEEDVNSQDEYETLDMPAGKITRTPAVERVERNQVFGREHSRVLLPCMPIDVSPLLSWSFTWTLPNGDAYTRPGRIVSRDWSKYIHRNGSLLLTRLESDDAGNYDCVAVNERKNVEYHTHISLEILERLRIRNPRSEYLQVETGSDVTIPCDVTGSPYPTIIWETPWGATLDNTGYIDDLEVLWNGTLRILQMKPGLRGSYICYAKNGHDLQMRTVTISIIMQRPVFISPTSGMVAVRPGGMVSLECRAKGNPEPTIQWILAKGGTIQPNQAIFSGSTFIPKYRVLKDGDLIITRANNRDVGNYHCVITNYLGRSASTIKLVIGIQHR